MLAYRAQGPAGHCCCWLGHRSICPRVRTFLGPGLGPGLGRLRASETAAAQLPAVHFGAAMHRTMQPVAVHSVGH
jgi:hypothetical protein